MRIEERRNEALVCSVQEGFEKVVDRLLTLGVTPPDLDGAFHVTVDGTPGCVAHQALAGVEDVKGSCQHRSLRRCVQLQRKLKVAFPGATVAIKAGECPKRCSSREGRMN